MMLLLSGRLADKIDGRWLTPSGLSLPQNMYTPASMAKRQRLSGLRPESNGTLISEG